MRRSLIAALPDLQKQLEKLELEQKELDKQAGASDDDRLVQYIVTPEVVASVVSRWTGIPVNRLLVCNSLCVVFFCY